MQITNEELQINEYVNLIHFVIHKFYKYHPNIEYEDLFQVGNIGLLQAIRTYEPNHGACFSTWAVLQIKNAIGQELRKSHAKKRNGVVVSLNKPIGDNSRELLDVIPAYGTDKDFETVCLNLMLSDEKLFTKAEIEVLQSLIMGQNAGISQQELNKLKSKIYTLLGRVKTMTTRQIKTVIKEEPAKVSATWDLSDFIVFDASNSVGSRDSFLITVGKTGRVTMSSSIGKVYQVGTKIEVLLNKKSNIIMIRQSEKGISCRINGKGSQGKLIYCKAILNHLNQNKIALPLKFTAEFDEDIQAWVGRR